MCVFSYLTAILLLAQLLDNLSELLAQAYRVALRYEYNAIERIGHDDNGLLWRLQFECRHHLVVYGVVDVGTPYNGIG